MALANYTDLKASIAGWLKRTDLTDQIDDFITLTEAKISRDIRLRSQVVASNIMCVNGSRSASLPSDWLEFENISIIGSPDVQLNYVNIQHLDTKWPGNDYTGQPVVYSIEGQSILFGPTPDYAYTVSVLYYKKYDALSVTPTNWLLTNHPGIYLYGALAEAAMYTFDDERVVLWQSKYKGEVDALSDSDTRAQFSGSALMVKAI
jgi:hypothetical protein